jgi:hypothetical protein
VRPPRAAESKEEQIERQNKYLNKKFIFLPSRNFNLLDRIQGNSINNCAFLNFIISQTQNTQPTNALLLLFFRYYTL